MNDGIFMDFIWFMEFLMGIYMILLGSEYEPLICFILFWGKVGLGGFIPNSGVLNHEKNDAKPSHMGLPDSQTDQFLVSISMFG